MKKILIILLISVNLVQAQTDYTQMNNWHFHPNKPINMLSNYNLDIAVIGKDLNVDSIISLTNNSTTNTGVDVFFVHPTQLTSIPLSPDTISISNQPSILIASTIIAQGGLLSKYGRFFAPKYRQSSPSAFNDTTFSESIRAEALLITYSDVKNSFLEYLNNHNNGNKIILAGHSQGSYLIGMLLRDLFDNDPNLRSKLVTASLGGMGFVYGDIGSYRNGWWENIPLCTQINECECIHNWKSFKESQSIPDANEALPAFNQVLVDSGLVYRTINLTNDWFVDDSLFYGITSSPLRYYIAPDNNYNLSATTDFIAFDSLYTVRFKRTSNTKTALAVDFTNDTLDQRPNDLLGLESHSNFNNWGFHQRDYHIYLWALMQQIDAKLSGCAIITNIEENSLESNISIYPNPNTGTFTLELKDNILNEEYFLITDALGRIVKSISCEASCQIYLPHSGLYFLVSKYETKKIIVK